MSYTEIKPPYYINKDSNLCESFARIIRKKAYKLFRLRKNGTLGSLFINRKQIIPIGTWLTAENHPTKGYAIRPPCPIRTYTNTQLKMAEKYG